MRDRLTLDTNIVYEWWKKQARHPVVAELLDLADQRLVELSVTASINDDIPHDPLAHRIAALPEIGIEEEGTVARVGKWLLGRDMLGDQDFVDWYQTLGVKAIPDWRDFDHLHAHMLLRRDYFLTWDGAILNLRAELNEHWGIEVRRPEEHLRERPLA